eukprot:1157632-Pleurochrysis_carterae.AAC.1
MSRSTSRPRSSQPAVRRSPRSGRSWQACDSLQGAPGEEADYQVRSNRKFFDVEPMAAEIEELNAENQRLGDEITEFKGIRYGAGQGVLPPRRLHPDRRPCHRRRHYDSARLAQPGASPLPYFRALLPRH